MTMHKAKGLSASAVFVVGVEDEYIPGRGEVDEERRLLYVSLTRARKYLFITYCKNRVGQQRHSGFLTTNTTAVRFK
jgi:superfamily I DNA/RNA helicase